MFRKIFYLLLILVIPKISFSIMSTKKFIDLCKLADQEKVSQELVARLKSKPWNIRQTWLTSFNRIYRSPIVYAVAMQNKVMAEALIKLSIEDSIAYFEFTTGNGYSLLTLAVMKNNIELVEMLLHYSHPLSMDKSHDTTSALHEATKCANISMCELLINLKKPLLLNNLIHTQDYKKQTPVNYAIRAKLPQIAITMLQICPVKIDNIPLDHDLRNYLHHAVIAEMLEVAEILLKQGIDPGQKSLLNETALSIAQDYKNTSIKQLVLFYLKGKNFRSYID